jgi:hypothetical protein
VSTTEHIKQVGKDAIEQLLEEAACFEQLANDYTDSNPAAGKYVELKKFAKQLKQVAVFIGKEIEQPASQKLSLCVRTAAILLNQSRHPRMKIRMELLGREINYLEENSDRWFPLKEIFISTVNDCRKIIDEYNELPVSISSPEDPDGNVDLKAALDKGQRDITLLQQADELFKQTTTLKSRQITELRVDRVVTLRQRLLSLNSELERLNKIVETAPELSKSCREITRACLQIEKKLLTKIKIGSLSDLEKAITIADLMTEQVKQGQIQNEDCEREPTIPGTTDHISTDDKLMEEQIIEKFNPSSSTTASNPVQKTKQELSLKEKNAPLFRKQSIRSAIVVSSYLICTAALVIFFLLTIRDLMH